jgi:hypothetical protein
VTKSTSLWGVEDQSAPVAEAELGRRSPPSGPAPRPFSRFRAPAPSIPVAGHLCTGLLPPFRWSTSLLLLLQPPAGCRLPSPPRPAVPCHLTARHVAALHIRTLRLASKLLPTRARMELDLRKINDGSEGERNDEGKG